MNKGNILWRLFTLFFAYPMMWLIALIYIAIEGLYELYLKVSKHGDNDA